MGDSQSMTKEQKLSTAAALVADANEKPWQWQNSRGNWNTGVSAIEERLAYGVVLRPAPEPEPPKPWDCLDDVPPVCWIRRKGKTNCCGLVCWVDPVGVGVVTDDHATVNPRGKSWETLTDFEFSADRKTWHPCVKAP